VQNTLLKKRLSSQYKLTFVFSGLDAINVIKSGESFNIVIVEFKKPFSNYLSVLEYIDENKINVKILGISSEPRSEVESQAILLGIDYFLPKPLDYESVLNLLAKWDSGVKIVHGIISDDDEKEKLPYFTLKRCCYICGYEDVKMHIPLKDGFFEDWSKGLSPYYHTTSGFVKWDFLRSMVAVCPYCCFASSNMEDWAEAPGKSFPYKSDAKKILSRTIAGRKKLVGISMDVDNCFDDPARSPERTIQSFKLAEKCVSGLILGEKSGTHVQLGFYNTILGSLQPELFSTYYPEAVENFSNQLKLGNMSNVDKIRAYFFLVGLKLFLGEYEMSKSLMHELSELYSEKNEAEISEEEKTWLQRVSVVWKNGVDSDFQRTLDF